MATKKITIPAGSWTQLNQGGEVTQSSFILKLKEGNVFIGSTADGSTDPKTEDCYNTTKGIVYTGTDYVYAKSSANIPAIGIIDGVN